MSLWDAVRYGWAPLYWIKISGVPVVWAERATGLTLPSGYTEDGALVIDASSAIGVEQIKREDGTAVSLSLSFKLLDTSTVRDWLRAPSKSMSLTAEMSATTTAATVDDSTGWSNGDAAHLGLERITIGTVASGTSLTGITRATVDTLAYEHRPGTTAQIVTDRPRYWRGREVTLYAAAADPSGYAAGSSTSPALLNDSRMVWRGYLDTAPTRELDGFAFQASSIDRITDRGLLASITGRVVDTSAKVSISSGYTITMQLRAYNSSNVDVWTYTLPLLPFASLSDGALQTYGQIRAAIVSAWADAVSDASAGSDLGDMQWIQYGDGAYRAAVEVVADATIKGCDFSIDFDGAQWLTFTFDNPSYFTAGAAIQTGWASKGNPLTPGGPSGEFAIPWVATVRVDDGEPSSIPAPGRIAVEAGGVRRVMRYAEAEVSEADAYLIGLQPEDGTQGYPSLAEMQGADVTILFGDSGDMPDMMLRALMSSGNGERSATYDTLDRGQGYGLDESVIDADSFTQASAPLGTLKGKISSAGESFATLFGGALGLFRAAVVARPDADTANTPIKLSLVDTAPYGADYSTTITDTDLLSDAGDPVVSVKRAPAPNVLAVVRPMAGDAQDRFVFADAPSIDANGRDELEYRVPAVDRAALYEASGPAAVSQLAADQVLQAIQIRVGPWVQAQVGDIVRLELTHPALWTWSTSPGAVGYTGQARVVGRTLELASSVVTLTLLADSMVTARSLSPAMLVSGYDSTTAPTYIDVPLRYLQHMSDAITATGGNVWLNHYQPGQAEGDTERHEISAAAENGGACRLTVASTTGGHSLSTSAESTLTLPTSAVTVSYQDGFAHVDDGGTWG